MEVAAGEGGRGGAFLIIDRHFPFSDAAETVFWMNNWRNDDLPANPGLHGDRENRCRKENDNGTWLFSVLTTV